MQTLGELRAKLQERVGFVSQGPASLSQRTLLHSFLQEAQTFLYNQVDWKHLKTHKDITLNAGQILYDWPDDCEPGKRRVLSVLINDQWYPLEQGIEAKEDTLVSYRHHPELYDDGPQIEIWPEPDQPYTLRVEYFKKLGSFTQESDPATLDDTLVFLMALTNAKSHYRHPDAENYASQTESMLRSLKGQQHGTKRYLKPRSTRKITIARPRTV